MVLVVIILFRHARTRLPVLKLNGLEKKSIQNLNDGSFHSPGICQMSQFLNSEHLINPQFASLKVLSPGCTLE